LISRDRGRFETKFSTYSDQDPFLNSSIFTGLSLSSLLYFTRRHKSGEDVDSPGVALSYVLETQPALPIRSLCAGTQRPLRLRFFDVTTSGSTAIYLPASSKFIFIRPLRAKVLSDRWQREVITVFALYFRDPPRLYF